MKFVVLKITGLQLKNKFSLKNLHECNENLNLVNAKMHNKDDELLHSDEDINDSKLAINELFNKILEGQNLPKTNKIHNNINTNNESEELINYNAKLSSAKIPQITQMTEPNNEGIESISIQRSESIRDYEENKVENDKVIVDEGVEDEYEYTTGNVPILNPSSSVLYTERVRLKDDYASLNNGLLPPKILNEELLNLSYSSNNEIPYISLEVTNQYMEDNIMSPSRMTKDPKSNLISNTIPLQFDSIGVVKKGKSINNKSKFPMSPNHSGDSVQRGKTIEKSKNIEYNKTKTRYEGVKESAFSNRWERKDSRRTRGNKINEDVKEDNLDNIEMNVSKVEESKKTSDDGLDSLKDDQLKSIDLLQMDNKQLMYKERIRIIENPEFHHNSDNIQEYEPTESEIHLRQQLYSQQMKDKKVKDNADDSSCENNLMDTTEYEKLNEENKINDHDDEGSTGSISTTNLINPFHTIRSVIDEKYIPRSLKGMNIVAILLLCIILGISIICYTLETLAYNYISKSIPNIGYSEQRLSWLIEINLYVKSLLLMKRYEVVDEETNLDYLNTKSQLLVAAFALKDSQDRLSTMISDMSLSDVKKINPENVQIEYMIETDNLPKYYNYTISQAVLEISLSALRMHDMSLNDIIDSEFSLVLILKNSLNSAWKALNQSTNEIISQIDSRIENELNIFLILLCIVSVLVLISIFAFTPIIITATNNKDKVFSLFLYLPRHEIIKYKSKCEQFKRSNKNESEEGNGLKQFNSGTSVDNSQVEERLDDNNNQETNKPLLNRKITELHHYRKHNKAAKNVVSLLVRLMIFLILIEVYFIVTCFSVKQFLDETSDLCFELYILISRSPTYGILLLIEEYFNHIMNREVIMYNDTTQIQFMNSGTFIDLYHNAMYKTDDRLLEYHSINKDVHTEKYKLLFEEVIYSNVCGANLVDTNGSLMNRAECESFSDGILKQGLFSAIIKYWDAIRQLNSDFFFTKRTEEDIKNFLLYKGMKDLNTMRSYYLKQAFETLSNKLLSDINVSFDEREKYSKVLFTIFIIYLIVFCVIGWRYFMFSIAKELWDDKSLLSMIPPEVLTENEEMKNYLIANSTVMLLNKKLN